MSVNIEVRDDAASFEVEPGTIDLCGQTGPLRLKNIEGVDNMNRWPKFCACFGRLIIGFLLAKDRLGVPGRCLAEGGDAGIVPTAGYSHSRVGFIYLIDRQVLLL